MCKILIHEKLNEKISNDQREEIIKYSHIIENEMRAGNPSGRIDKGIESLFRRHLDGSTRSIYFDYKEDSIKIIGIIKTKQKKQKDKQKKKLANRLKLSKDKDFIDITHIIREVEEVEERKTNSNDNDNKNEKNIQKLDNKKREKKEKIKSLSLKNDNFDISLLKKEISYTKSKNIEITSSLKSIIQENNSLKRSLKTSEDNISDLEEKLKFLEENQEKMKELLQKQGDFLKTLKENSNISTTERVELPVKENNSDLSFKKDDKVVNININL